VLKRLNHPGMEQRSAKEHNGKISDFNVVDVILT